MERNHTLGQWRLGTSAVSELPQLLLVYWRKRRRELPRRCEPLPEVWVCMYSAQPGLSLLFFFKHYTYSAAGNSDFFQVQPGWHIYSVDLRQGAGGGSGTWTQNGPYEGLRLDAPWGADNNLVQYDWSRLTPDTGSGGQYCLELHWCGYESCQTLSQPQRGPECRQRIPHCRRGGQQSRLYVEHNRCRAGNLLRTRRNERRNRLEWCTHHQHITVGKDRRARPTQR